MRLSVVWYIERNVFEMSLRIMLIKIPARPSRLGYKTMKHDFDARQYSESHIYISCFLKCHRQRQSMLIGS